MDVINPSHFAVQYPNRVFKIAAISKWVIVFSGKQYIDDICRASDDVLSFTEAVEEVKAKPN